MMKKKLFFAALAVCLIAVIACGSLAYFTGNSTKSNKFMTAAYDPTDNDPDPDDIFSIEVQEESKKVESNPNSVEGTEREDKSGYDYTDLLPGAEAAKKVTIANTGEYGAYIRANITVTKASEWQAIYGKTANLAEKLADVDKVNWTFVKATPDTDNNTVTYTYYYAKSGTGTVLAKGTSTEPIFTTVTIDKTLTTEQFFTVDGFEIQISSEAIQSEYTGTIAEAFGKYDEQNKPKS